MGFRGRELIKNLLNDINNFMNSIYHFESEKKNI